MTKVTSPIITDETGKRIAEQLTRIADQGSSSIDGIDLSFRDILGVNLVLRNTANMYVCRAAGLYRLPLVYGNAIKNSHDNPLAYTSGGGAYQSDFVNHLGNRITNPYIERHAGCAAASAVLVGQSAQGMITEVKLMDGPDCRYLQFSLASVPDTNGLAIVAVKDTNGKIMWSWKIWVTTDNLIPENYKNHTNVDYYLLNEAIGAIWNAERTHYVSPMFQWGRMEVVGIPSAYNSNTLMTMYDISGNAVSWDTYGVADDSDVGGTVRSVANSIQKPMTFFLEYDNVNYNWNNLVHFNNFWNAALNTTNDLDDNQATAIKTIYDPNPVGYMMPAGRFATGFTTTGSNTATPSEFNVVGSFNAGWNIKKDANDNVGSHWHASGYQYRTSGGLDYVGSRGYFWTCAPASQDGARNLYFGSGNINPLYDGYRASGAGVRPSRELN